MGLDLKQQSESEKHWLSKTTISHNMKKAVTFAQNLQIRQSSRQTVSVSTDRPFFMLALKKIHLSQHTLLDGSNPATRAVGGMFLPLMSASPVTKVQLVQ